VGLPVFRAAGNAFRFTGFQPVVAVRRDDRSYLTDLKERSVRCWSTENRFAVADVSRERTMSRRVPRRHGLEAKTRPKNWQARVMRCDKSHRIFLYAACSCATLGLALYGSGCVIGLSFSA